VSKVNIPNIHIFIDPTSTSGKS